MTIESKRTIWTLIAVALRARDFKRAQELLDLLKQRSALGNKQRGA
jgi:hypothetical protein